jgi:hypothetical protein
MISAIIWILGLLLAIVGVYYLVSGSVIVGAVCLVFGILIVSGYGFVHH